MAKQQPRNLGGTPTVNRIPPANPAPAGTDQNAALQALAAATGITVDELLARISGQSSAAPAARQPAGTILGQFPVANGSFTYTVAVDVSTNKPVLVFRGLGRSISLYPEQAEALGPALATPAFKAFLKNAIAANLLSYKDRSGADTE